MSAAVQASPNEIVVSSPANGREVGRVPVMSADDVRAAVKRARAAQAAWGALPVDRRVKLLRAYRDELAASTETIVDLVVRENGKPAEEVLYTELMPLVNIASWYCAKAPRVLKPKKLRSWGVTSTRKSYVHYVPRGVVAAITPWNFPFMLPMTSVFAALITGNAVVVKPSEWTPLIMVEAKRIFDRVAGGGSAMSPDLFQVVTGFGPTGQALLESGVDKVEFTGSVATGKKIGEFCGARLIPCTLELGGKAPAIVCDDADLDRAATAIAWGGFCNAGQVCVGVERVLVAKKVAPALTEKLTAIIGTLRMGDPSAPGANVDVGAMTFPKQLDNVERLVDDARARGARVLTGGKRLPGPGRFYPPTILAGVTPDMPIAREEIFGPALPIIEVADDEEAIRVANDSHLGLNAYVFSRDRRRARLIAERVRAGTTAVNDVLQSFVCAELPFGGVKESGIGRVHGEQGLLAMVEARGVNVERIPAFRRDFWMYPYDHRLSKRITQVARKRMPLVGKLLDLIAFLA